ncbi:MAG: prenyltransferase/squalene oxidase repeat-containing protein [Promethearchaeota archaeon]
MKPHNYRNLTIIFLILLIGILITPYVLAKPRKSYLTDYILGNKVENEGFSNTNSTDDVSYEATAYALEILKYYDLYEVPGLFGKKTVNVNVTETKKELKKEVRDLVPKKNRVIIYDLYYLLRALDALNTSVKDELKDDIEDYLDASEQVGGGFAPLNTSSTPTLISTYFACRIYKMINRDIEQESKHVDWVKSCLNGDGGYGGNSSSSSTLLNTYYAVLFMDFMADIDDLENSDDTIDYIDSFFVDDESDQLNFGGYLPDENAKYASLSSTYYCVKVLSLLDSDKLHQDNTTAWILKLQNFRDGVFSDNTDGKEQYKSSIIASYFAFETLKIFDSELDVLEEHVWMVEFNWWILIILLISLGIAITAIIIIWRRKRI